MRLRSLLTTRGRAFLGAGSVLAASGIVFGFRDLTRFGVLLLVLPFLSAALVRSRRARMRITRELHPRRVAVGTNASVDLTLTNASGRRTPVLMAEERIDYALGDRPRFLVTDLAPGQSQTVRYPIRTRSRGLHRLGPLGVVIDDPFGLAHRSAILEGNTDFIVLPRVLPLGGSRPPTTGVGSEGDQAHLVALHGEDDVTVREYRDGDDLRRIHWPSTARTGELMVRQEDRPAQRRAVLVLDPRPEAHGGTGPTSSFEWAVSAVASLAVHLEQAGYAVHLVCAETVADGRAAEPLPSQTLLPILAQVQMRSRSENDVMLRAAQTLTNAGGLLCAVTGTLDPEVTRRIASLRSTSMTGLAMVLDAHSFGTSQAQDPSGHLDTFQLAGWRSVLVSRTSSVSQVWDKLTTVAVGERR